MLNQNFGMALQNAYAESASDPIPPQPWTGDVASALTAIETDLSIALEALRHLDGRLFGFAPETAIKGKSAEKPQSIADDFAERLSTLREISGALMSRAQRLNNRI